MAYLTEQCSRDEFSCFHDRQVVVLPTRKEQDAWLDPDTSPEDALALLRPLPPGLLRFRPVGPAVGMPGYHGPDYLVEGIVEPPARSLKIKRPARSPKKSHSQDELL